MSAPLVSIIGPPACGKTTLGELLAAELPAELIREDYGGNSFLAESYAGSGCARLPGQLYFLLSRVSQLWAGRWPADGLRVSDYGFCQDRVFAEVRLSPEEMELYDRLARRLEGLVRPPDVLVHLDARESTLLERIANRGRHFERVMTMEFLATMRRKYDEASQAAACPVIRVDCDKVDLLAAFARAEIVAAIRKKLGWAGREIRR